MLYHSKKVEEAGNLGKAKEDLQMVLYSLQCMARGGVHDHIGGGFHRYSVDECWHGWFSTRIFCHEFVFKFLKNA